ncbi:MAG: hypothetical protein KDD37_00355 [Bdellovibrionales bacterium]|nr:hypothetical protein [Bdellovibrionales bacterium]
MTKFVAMYILLTAPFMAVASYQCDINVRSAYSLDSLVATSPNYNYQKLDIQIDSTDKLKNCADAAVYLLNERCVQSASTSGGVADAVITYSHGKARQYKGTALIRGACQQKSIMTAIGYKVLGFKELERYGLIERNDNRN